MSDFLDQVLSPEDLRPATLWFSLRIRSERLDWSVRYSEMGESRSASLLGGGISRPEGKTRAECVEAGLYRLARAGSDGLLVPPGWDRL